MDENGKSWTPDEMDGEWKVWIPDEMPEDWPLSFFHIFELVELSCINGKLKLVFEGGENRVTVCYEYGWLTFRYADESDRWWNTLASVQAARGGDFFLNRLTFIVEGSKYKKWYVQETAGIWQEDSFEHHC